MKEQMVTLADIVALARRNIESVIVAVALAGFAGVLVAWMIAPQFKSEAMLTIQASYFQTPLVNDLISDINDPAEQRAQRTALLQLALSEEFLDKLGGEYGLISAAAGTKQRAIERELFRKKIDFYPDSATAYQASVVAGDPRIAFEMMGKILSQMMTTLVNQRQQMLVKTRDAIEKQLNTLTPQPRERAVVVQNGESVSTESLPLESRRIQLEDQLSAVKIEVAGLLERFTEAHPQVKAAMRQQDKITAQLAALPSPHAVQKPKGKTELQETLETRTSKNPSREFYDDLIKKYVHLNIVLDTESDAGSVPYLSIIEQPTLPTRPIFPSKRMFGLFGALFGLLFAIGFIVIRETDRAQELTPEAVSEILGGKFLGNLPRFEQLAYTSNPLALPAPTQRLRDRIGWTPS